MKKTKTTGMEDSIIRKLETISSTYSDGVNFFPTTVFVDFKWAVKDKDVKEENMSICVPFKTDNKKERFETMSRLGFAAAVLEKLGVTSAPDQAIIASEAYASRFDKSEAVDTTEEKITSDKNKIEIALVHGVDKNGATSSMIREVVSKCKDSGDSMSIVKELVVTERMKKDGMDKFNPLESPLLDEFWDGFKLGVDLLKKEEGSKVNSYLMFLDVAKDHPKEIMSMVLNIALNEK